MSCRQPRGPSATEDAECFGCHSTLLAASGRGELDPVTMIPNVTCERCHGPAHSHVAAARRSADELGMPLGPGAASTADIQMRHCGGLPSPPRHGPRRRDPPR